MTFRELALMVARSVPLPLGVGLLAIGISTARASHAARRRGEPWVSRLTLGILLACAGAAIGVGYSLFFLDGGTISL